MKENKDYTEVDLRQLFRALVHKAWAIILAAVLCGGAALAYTQFMITPLYKARTLMYVNNNSLSVGSTKVSISQGDLSAAQSLIGTYTVILQTRSTLEEVIETADLPYTYEQLRDMVSAASVNSTEIFYIEVTDSDPAEAELIANTIGQILPDKIASIVDGSSVRIVDYAVEPSHRSSPSLTENTALGMLIGIVISCAVIVILQLTDDLIHDSDYLAQNYDIPVLAVIPDLTVRSSGKGSYQSSYQTASHVQGGKENG